MTPRHPCGEPIIAVGTNFDVVGFLQYSGQSHRCDFIVFDDQHGVLHAPVDNGGNAVGERVDIFGHCDEVDLIVGG